MNCSDERPCGAAATAGGHTRSRGRGQLQIEVRFDQAARAPPGTQGDTPMSTLVNYWSSADDVTPADLTERLRSGGVITASTSVASVTHEPIGIGVGILALLWRLDVRYDPEGAGPRTMILKLPHTSAGVRFLAHVLRFYEREVGFYENVAASTPIGTASCYWSTFDPATKDFELLLEDIGGLDCYDQLAGIPIGDVRVAARALARTHAPCWERQDLLRASW